MSLDLSSPTKPLSLAPYTFLGGNLKLNEQLADALYDLDPALRTCAFLDPVDLAIDELFDTEARKLLNRKTVGHELAALARRCDDNIFGQMALREISIFPHTSPNILYIDANHPPDVEVFINHFGVEKCMYIHTGPLTDPVPTVDGLRLIWLAHASVDSCLKQLEHELQSPRT